MSSNCVKCGAELIGTRKFCTACGAAVLDPRGATPPASAAAPGSVVVSSGETPALNPFAVTAPPNTRSPFAPPRASPYGPPSGQAIITPVAVAAVQQGAERHIALSETETDPKALPMLPAIASSAGGTPAPGTPSVSPLAVSGLLSAAAAEREAVAAAQEEIRNIEAASRKAPGTQLMPSSAAPRPERTHLMSAVPLPSVRSPSGAGAAAAAARGSAPSTSKMPVAPASAPASGASKPPASALGSSPPWTGAPYSAPAPHQSFGYVPGNRVRVTWANGQRFPATVQQTTATQCLVVFDNGQQHWVDMQYVAPA